MESFSQFRVARARREDVRGREMCPSQTVAALTDRHRKGALRARRGMAAFCALSQLLACATYEPIIDPVTIPDQAKYEQDLAECRELTEKHRRTEEEVTDTAVGTAVAAGGTTIIAAIVTAAVSAGTVVLTAVAWPFIAGAAVVGGTVWGVRARRRTIKERATLIDGCLRGRGYEPLPTD